MFPFIMKESAYQEMAEYCKSKKPIEACGLLSGKNKTITTIWCLPNAENSPFRFSITPELIKQTFMAMEQKEEIFYGIFHSHPTAPPFPSYEDIANANYPDVTYVIISLMFHHPFTQCFHIHNGKVTKKNLVLIP